MKTEEKVMRQDSLIIIHILFSSGITLYANLSSLVMNWSIFWINILPHFCLPPPTFTHPNPITDLVLSTHLK